MAAVRGQSCRGRLYSLDPAAGVPAAGCRSGGHGLSSRGALQPDLYCPSAPVPENQQQFRKDGAAVGEARRRPGAGPPAAGPARFGRPTGVHPRAESVGAVLQVSGGSSSSSHSRILNERKEAVYESNKREPLGKAYVRGHPAPAALADESAFRFGKTTGAPRHSSEQQGKDIICPVEPGSADPEEHERYVRTHNAFEPGEQVDRGYAWPQEVARENHRFGRPDGARLDGAGVRAALSGTDPDVEGGEMAVQQTRIVPISAEDFRRAVRDPIGGRARGVHGAPPVPAEFAFGTRSKHEASAAECLKGNYSAEEQLPDKDLGRCIREGRRNITAETRAFGKPSRVGAASRSSCAAPLFRPPPRVAVAAMHDDAGAAQTLAPDCLEAKGLVSDEFSEPRDRREVQSLLEGAGYRMSAEEFDHVWDSASRGEQHASLKEVIRARADYHAAM